MVPKIRFMIPKKWYDPFGSILFHFHLKIHTLNDFWGGVPDLMGGGPRPNGIRTRLEYAPISKNIDAGFPTASVWILVNKVTILEEIQEWLRAL